MREFNSSLTFPLRIGALQMTRITWIVVFLVKTGKDRTVVLRRSGKQGVCRPAQRSVEKLHPRFGLSSHCIESDLELCRCQATLPKRETGSRGHLNLTCCLWWWKEPPHSLPIWIPPATFRVFRMFVIGLRHRPSHSSQPHDRSLRTKTETFLAPQCPTAAPAPLSCRRPELPASLWNLHLLWVTVSW